jgi:hypothetical protein
MSIEIYDILKDDYWKNRVLDSIPEIVTSGHYNAKNYEKLESRLSEYECFNVVVENNRMVAISGLYNGGIYPGYTARILDRTYYYDWNTNGGMFSPYRTNLRYNSFYVIPYQMKIAKQKGFDSVFISMQTPKKRRALEMMTLRQPDFKFEMLPDLYNTCKCSADGSASNGQLCWQNISIHYITDQQKFELPRMTIVEYYERYKDIKSIR